MALVNLSSSLSMTMVKSRSSFGPAPTTTSSRGHPTMLQLEVESELHAVQMPKCLSTILWSLWFAADTLGYGWMRTCTVEVACPVRHLETSV